MTTNETQQSKSRQPLATVRSGAIGASIWEQNASDGSKYLTFSLSRAWKSAAKEGYSQNYFAHSRDDLLKVIDKACEMIELLQQQKKTGSVTAAPSSSNTGPLERLT